MSSIICWRRCPALGSFGQRDTLQQLDQGTKNEQESCEGSGADPGWTQKTANQEIDPTKQGNSQAHQEVHPKVQEEVQQHITAATTRHLALAAVPSSQKDAQLNQDGRAPQLHNQTSSKDL